MPGRSTGDTSAAPSKSGSSAHAPLIESGSGNVRLLKPTGLAEGVGQEASGCPTRQHGAIHPLSDGDDPRPHDAGHPVRMGSPAPPPVEAASSAIYLEHLLEPSLLSMRSGPPRQDGMPIRS